MTLTPAEGERAALRGYRWQYDHIAELVYDALYEGDFESLRLTDPDAGRVDDLVLVRDGRTDAYQFKSGRQGYLTFSAVVGTGSGAEAPSLVESLADGWTRLLDRGSSVFVHLTTELLASVNDHLGDSRSEDRPSPDHFDAFLERVLVPLRSGLLEVEDVPAGWQPAIQRLREASGLGEEDFSRFLRALHIEVAAGAGLPTSPTTRRADIMDLSDSLSRLVSEAADVVELDTQDVLRLMGWTSRTTLQSPHDFPVDLDTYAPLTDAINQLGEGLGKHSSGYLAVTGPPGSGKSTLLSQALTGSKDRIIRYYAYVPGAGPTRTRVTARAFLHDLVLMLTQEGLEPHEHQLASGDVNELRRQLFEQFDAASREFEESCRRTIVVVDGLDHVDREYRSEEALLPELPAPIELPAGVIVIVGSRTLEPLRPEAQEQVEQRNGLVDLAEHPLSPTSVINICRRASLTADLDPEVHQRIASLSGGHPLSLSYLLNRFRDAPGETGDDVLTAVPPYEGDIAHAYRAVWEGVESDGELLDILSVCCRLRVGFTTKWLRSWASPSAVGAFQKKLRYLFHRHHDGWRFFHDSFRQFAADRTSLGDDGPGDPDADQHAHLRIAELCCSTSNVVLAAEQLYHRHRSGDVDTVLALAQQGTFREQFLQLRSPELIRDDIALALEVAAERADVLAIFRLLLALTEVHERRAALEDVDMPALFYEAGLVDEALAYCRGETLGVPLAQVYGLAASLGAANDPAGRQLFDLVEQHGFDDPTRLRVSGEEDAAALAWARAAIHFRPIAAVLAAIRPLAEAHSDEDHDRGFDLDDRWGRYSGVMEVLIEESSKNGNTNPLLAIDAELQRLADILQELDEVPKNRVARVMDLRVRANAGLVGQSSDAKIAETLLDGLGSFLRGVPLFASTMLDVAELLARHERVDQATELLDKTPYDEALTASNLSDVHADSVLERDFRYWRLRFLLAEDDGEVPDSVRPDEATPAGNDIQPSAASHLNLEAIQLASRVDDAMRDLAKLDAAVSAGRGVSRDYAWQVLAPMFDIFPSAGPRYNATLNLIRLRQPEVMGTVVDVAARYGEGLPQLVSDAFVSRFDEEPQQWPLHLRLDLGESLQAAGATTPWYEDTLLEHEEAAGSETVYERLNAIADLVHQYARAGDSESAQRLVFSMTSMAFGVGFRKDHQLDSWVGWLGRALSGPGGERFVDEAEWLARFVRVVEPTTEGALRDAAARLPSVVAAANAVAGVRIFEYLVRHGTASHPDSLASLVEALASQAQTDQRALVDLAADVTGEIIVPVANRAYPELASTLTVVAQRVAGSEQGTRLVESLASRTDSYALPSTRAEWRHGLGLPTSAGTASKGEPEESPDDYGALVLSDGRRFGRTEAESLIETVDDIVRLRAAEAGDSHFHWERVVRGRALPSTDVLRLEEAFADDPERHASVFAALAEVADNSGDQETALRLATTAFSGAPSDGWAWYGGSARRRAAAVLVRRAGGKERIAACKDLVRQATSNPWVPRLLLLDSEEIVDALDSTLPASSFWPEVRTHLDGMAECLDLGEPEGLADHGCRWWLLPPSGDHRKPINDSTPSTALAELAVGHLSHPTWLVRDAATTTVVRALRGGNQEVAEALARFAQPDSTDDTLERVGRCLAAARSREGHPIPRNLERLESILASHPNQIIRRLAAEPAPKVVRPLPPAYRLSVPAEATPSVGTEGVFPVPYQTHYKVLADGLGIDLNTLLFVAAGHATEALDELPKQEDVEGALVSSGAKHAHPLEELAASRAGFGRVLRDLTDAGMLENAPAHIRRLLRTFDLDLVARTPLGRPGVTPAMPPAGHDQTVERWQQGLEERLDEYEAVASKEDQVLIGASARLTVLNWGHLEEEFVCGVTCGTSRTSDDRPLELEYDLFLSDLGSPAHPQLPRHGEALVIENSALSFHQIQANWLSFKPEAAAALAWTPDPDAPGRWRTSHGDVAVDTTWWVDGWWGRRGPAFDDTEAVGYAVVLTAQGLAEVVAAFGDISRTILLKRGGRDGDGKAVEPVSATRSVLVTA